MRFTVLLLFFFFSITTTATADNSSEREKLLGELRAAAPEQKMTIYRNLADLSFGAPEEYTYLQQLCGAARACNDTPGLLEALSDLAYLHVKQKQVDSVNRYMQLIRECASSRQAEPYLCYLRLRLFDKRIMDGDMEAFTEESQLLDPLSADDNSPYVRIEQAFVTGKALYVNGKHREALPYLYNAEQLCTDLPGKKAAEIQLFIKWWPAKIYNILDDGKTYISLVEEQLEIQKKLIGKYYTDRPYYPADLYYLFFYAALFSHIELLPEEKIEAYMLEIKNIGSLTYPIGRHNRFWTMKQYYEHKGELDNSIGMLDSLQKYIRELSPTDLPELLQEKSDLCQRAGRDTAALETFKEFLRCKDSLAASNVALQLGGMEQVYEVDKLSFENTRLTNTRKHMQATILGIVFALGMGICSYLYYGLRKTKRTQQRLHELSLMAEQSEHLKTQFINQMYHEIRTPLNAITGFSQLATDPSLDDQMRSEMCSTITQNTARLSSMIEQMLTVAGLSGSDEVMECTSVQVDALCRQEFEKLRMQGKPSIDYRLEMPQEPITVIADKELLTTAIRSLLDNAEKFTLRGQITLAAETDKPNKIVRITLTDTGCGIPADKAEVVFDRFTKLDPFSAGTGLGLYLSRLIIERHNGRLFIDPGYMEGARLIIELPWARGGEFPDFSASDN